MIARPTAAQSRIATYSTRQLVDALVAADKAPWTLQNAITREWLIEEVEYRYPAVSDAVKVERTGQSATTVDYVALLVANIPPADLA